MTGRSSNLLVMGILGGVVFGSPAGVFAQDRSVVGEWGDVLDWPLVSIHMVALKNGKVLCSSGLHELMAPGGPFPTPCILFDPSDDTVSAEFLTPEDPNDPGRAHHNIYASGVSSLPDGKIVYNGGSTQRDFGDKTTIYDPDDGHNGTFTVLI